MPSTFQTTLAGARESLPVLAAVAPFAAIFGTLATAGGLDAWQVLLASATIYAGASQYAMLDLLGQSAPAWSILLAVFAINARHILYSAAIGRRLDRFGSAQRFGAFALLVDPQFAAAEQRHRDVGRLEPAWYFGYAAGVYGTWMVCNAVGIVFGDRIGSPEAWGFDLVLPAYFLALVMGFRSTDGFWPLVVISAGVALAAWQLIGSPWQIIVGAGAGIVYAAYQGGSERGDPDTPPSR